MKTILIRSKTTDSAVFKVADTLFKNDFKVELLVWDREDNLNTDDYLYKIHKFGLKAPSNRFSVLFFLPLWWIYELYFLLKNNYDVIHACDLDTLWPAIMTKTIKRNKLFYTIYDFYANNLPYGRPYLLRNFIRYIMSVIEKFGIGFTDVLFLTDKHRYDEVNGAEIKNIVYIYNSPPDYYLTLEESNENLNKSSYLSLFYGGGISKQRGLEYLIKAVEELDAVLLTIAGVGPDISLVNKYTNIKGNIKYVGWLPLYKDILKKTSESDVIIRLADPKIPRTKYDSPNKLFEAMMCGKPIIMNSEMGISEIVTEEECGILVPYGDINAIKEAIIQLKNLKLRNKLGLNGRKAYENKYNWRIMEKRLLTAYEKFN